MKKRFGSILASVSVALAFIFALAGCSFFQAKEKTFEKAGMSITLTSEFVEKEIVSQTVYYESRSVIVMALKEEFSAYPGVADYSLERYTNMTISGNNLDAQYQQREGQNYLYFSYQRSSSGKTFYYLATTHKMSDAFWLIQFACVAEDKDKYSEQFLQWADTITETPYNSGNPGGTGGSGELV